MNHPSRFLLVLAAILALSSAGFSQGLPPVPVPAGNPITAEKAVLGKILFWEEQLSADNRLACGTCHLNEWGGGDPRFAVNPGPDGVFGNVDDIFGSSSVRRAGPNNDFIPDPNFFLFPQVTGRAAPTTINAAYSPELLWSGAVAGGFDDPDTGANILPTGGALETLSAVVPLSGGLMGHDSRMWANVTGKLQNATPLKLASNIPADVATALGTNATYPALFQAAFGSTQITAARVAMALATYQRTLVSDQTPYDDFLNGNTSALTLAQQAGLNTFNGVGQCNQCHSGAETTDQSYHNIGIRPASDDAGRMDATGNPSDLGLFKTPTLRNFALRPKLMHNGRFFSIWQVISFYARQGDFTQNQDPIMGQIALPGNLWPDLVDFLVHGLTDPRVAQGQFPFDRPTLHSETNGFGSFTFGDHLAGTGGFTPIMLAFDPPNIGNTDYRLGVTSTLGASTAFLLFSNVQAAPSTVLSGIPFAVDVTDPSFDFLAFPTAGSGAGDGYATAHFPIPNSPALVGMTRYVQWLVFDPASTATLPYSASRGAEIVVF